MDDIYILFGGTAFVHHNLQSTALQHLGSQMIIGQCCMMKGFCIILNPAQLFLLYCKMTFRLFLNIKVNREKILYSEFAFSVLIHRGTYWRMSRRNRKWQYRRERVKLLTKRWYENLMVRQSYDRILRNKTQPCLNSFTHFLIH